MSQYIQEFNKRNLLENVVFLDAADNVCMTTYGYAKLQIEYDDNYQRVSDIYYDDHDNIIANSVYTEMLLFSNGAIFKNGIPLRSILLKWNDWKIGETQEKLLRIQKQSRYGEKDAYFLTPDGVIMHIHVDAGLWGAKLQPHFMDAKKAKEALARIEKD